MGSWKVSAEAVAAIQDLSARLEDLLRGLTEETITLDDALDGSEDGLGAHSADIRRLVEETETAGHEAGYPVRKLRLKLDRAAAIRRHHLEKNPYSRGESGASEGAAYVPTKVPSSSGVRTVYENRRIDPDLIVPAGTRFANGRILSEAKSNLELMEEGKAPFVPVRDANGKTVFVPVELHHLTGREKIRGATCFGGEPAGGSLIELPAHVHDIYSGVLHIPGESGSSFRKDENGEKSEDQKNYEQFRREHWKERARRIRPKKDV